MRPPAGLPLLLAAALAGCAGAQRTGDAPRRVRLAMAERFAAQGDWSAAFEAADAICREDPDDEAGRLLRARALRRAGAMAEAEADLKRVLERDSRSAGAHAELAVLCEETSRPEDALLHHREALRLAPGEARYLNNLGFALLARGRPQEAVPLLEEGLRASPADARLRNNLGYAYAAAGDFSRAAGQFALGGTRAQASNNLGFAYERARNLPQAFDLYLEAVRLDPAAALPRRNLEQVARELGRTLPPEAAGPAAGENGGT